MIKVVNKYKHIPTENDIYIGRGSLLGNPYTSIKDRLTKAEFICETREESIEKYKEWFLDRIQWDAKLQRLLIKISSMKEANLVCFCKPKMCHGDFIKEYFETHKIA